MKYLLLTLSLLLYIGVLAQEEEEEYFEESIIQSSEFKNLSKAKYNMLNVKTLDLKKNEADKFLKAPLNFPNLENLVIHFSKIREIQNLKNKKLTSIRIMYSWHLETLSNDFNQYEKSKKLEIYNCSLTELPSSIFNNKSISSICLCNNKITDFPEISENNNIKELYLDLNKLKKLPTDFLNFRGQYINTYI